MLKIKEETHLEYFHLHSSTVFHSEVHPNAQTKKKNRKTISIRKNQSLTPQFPFQSITEEDAMRCMKKEPETEMYLNQRFGVAVTSQSIEIYFPFSFCENENDESSPFMWSSARR